MPSVGELRTLGIRLLAKTSYSPALDTDMMLCNVLGVERAYLLAHPEYGLTDQQAAGFERLFMRALAEEPVAYILGKRGFYDREFTVTPDVLIPRPETELLLEQALAWAQAHDVKTAADIGTGSGALAVTFAAHVPGAAVYAVDLSRAALDIARENAETHAVGGRITFLEGDLLAPLIVQGVKLDLLMANLPYIPNTEVPELAVSRHEPMLALNGGDDGLDLVRRLLASVREVCKPGALVLLEIGARQGKTALALAQVLQPQSAVILPDYAEHDRILRIEL